MNRGKIITIRPDREVTTKQQLPYFLGVSAVTAGAKGLSMNLVVIPPGGSAQPHVHKEYETAIYILHGEVETRYGDQLKQISVNRAGDFVYIPPDLPHQAFNLSSTEAALAIVARNDANEQEDVLPYTAY